MMRPRIIDFPVHPDETGNLYVADMGVLPFVPMRVFWMDNLSGERGNHALKTCHQIIVAVRGKITVETVDSNNISDAYFLDYPHQGLYLPPMTWRRLEIFIDDPICMVLASQPYDPDDYIHSYAEFKNAIMEKEMSKGIKFADEVLEYMR